MYYSVFFFFFSDFEDFFQSPMLISKRESIGLPRIIDENLGVT